MKRLFFAAVFWLAAIQSYAHAAIEIQWWHAMAGANNDLIVKLAQEFNAKHSEYKITPTYKGSYAETMNAGIAAFRAGQAPHILQVFEAGTATMMSAKGAIKPVHQLMQEAGVPLDSNAFLPTVASYYSTPQGQLLSYPFNASTLVMWVNKDALAKAGLDPEHPPSTWPEVFAAARQLHTISPTCGFSVAWATWALIEQFSAWHNAPIGDRANGLDGLDTQLVFNTPLQARFLTTLAMLQKNKTFDYSGRANMGEGRFTSGECPLLLTSSAFYGDVRANAKFAYTAAPMPYYPEIEEAPQNAIIGGASLWVMGGKSAAEYKGVAEFLAFLAETDRQVEWHEKSGYLPITKAAYMKAKADGFYEKYPYLEVAIKALTAKTPTENSRGLRFGNMAQMRDIWAEEIEMILMGDKPALEALDSAVQRGDALLRRFEKTASH